jgi:hypothetical protein
VAIEVILDDIWADEAERSVRCIKQSDGRLRVEFTDGVGGQAVEALTLTDWRAKRLASALAAAFVTGGDGHTVINITVNTEQLQHGHDIAEAVRTALGRYRH